MAKKNKQDEIPSWIKDLYKEDLDRVVKGERPMYFRGWMTAFKERIPGV